MDIARFALFFALSLSISSSLYPQSEAATLRGSVHETTQAVVSGASITLTNLHQGRTCKATSNVSGSYDIEQIPPGRYSWTTQTFNGSAGGNPVASMLLGRMSTDVIGYQPALAVQVPYVASYL